MKKIERGDWIRIYRNGRMVVAVAQYDQSTDSSWPYDVVHTDIGRVGVSEILEVRSYHQEDNK
jgi:hypothetical protein